MSSKANHRFDPVNETYAFSSDDEIGVPYQRYSTPSNPRHRSRSSRQNSKLSRSLNNNRSHNSTTISLSDFERDYLPSSSRKQPTDKTRPERNHLEPLSRPVKVLVGFRRWMERASLLKIAVVGCVLGLLCAVVYQGVLHLGPLKGGKDTVLPCPSDEPCLETFQLKPALLLAQVLRDYLHSRAGQFDCGVKSALSRNVTLNDMYPLLPEEYKEDSAAVRHAMYLILHNPHWGIRWLDRQGNSVTTLSSPLPSDVLESTQPRLTWQCYVSIILTSLWDRVRLALLVVLAMLLAVTVVRWYMMLREHENRAVYLMVDRIIDLLKKHYKTSSQDKDLLPYLAIIHVRDTLIPPSERKSREAVWTKACEWISANDSRVRVENRRIAGEDFLVWRWIQEDPPKTEEPSLTDRKTGAPPTVIKNDKRRRNEWSPWTAIDHYGPKFGEKVAPPVGTPSPYIRLKNMFDTIRMDDEQAKQIENSVLDRCTPHGAMVHVYVDRKSAFGCVYLKMDTLQSATKAYRALHGGWYNGKLVTAKYIEEFRYLKWFPQAAHAKQQLKPSS